MGKRIGRILRGQIVTSIIYILLGLCLLLMPVETVNLICKLVFGIVLIIAGLYHILIYVMEKLNATAMDLFSGGILLVVGVFLFSNPQVVIKLLPILLGAFILVDSIWTLKGAFRLKKRGNGRWKILLIGSLIFIVLGIVMIVNPFKVVKYTTMFAGGVLLCNGILDLVFMILIKIGMKEVKEAVEEAVEEATAVDADTNSSDSGWSFSFLKKEEKEAEEVQAAEEVQTAEEVQPAAADTGKNEESAESAASSESTDSVPQETDV